MGNCLGSVGSESPPEKIIVKRALLIGILYKHSNNEVSGSENDCYNLRRFFLENEYFSEDEIITMTDYSAKELLPTKSNIMGELESIVSVCNNNPDAECYIYVWIGSHGSGFIKDKDGDEKNGYDQAIWPLDIENGPITDDYLRTEFVEKLGFNAKLVFMVGSCYSGSMIDSRYEYDEENGFKYEVNNSVKESRCKSSFIGASRQEKEAIFIWTPNKWSKKHENQDILCAAFLHVYKHGMSYKDLMLGIYKWIDYNTFVKQRPQLTSGRIVNVKNSFLLTDFRIKK